MITHLDWTDGAAAKVQEPTPGKKELGWVASEKPAFEFMNWLFWAQDQINKQFEIEIEAVKATATTFDAVVGIGGTHADFITLFADPDIAIIKNVSVVSPITLTTPIAFSQNDMRFTFKPQAILAGIPGLAQGLVISGERVRIDGCRFINFSDTGARAIELESSSKYCMINNNFFLNCDTTVLDNGSVNSINNNIEEV